MPESRFVTFRDQTTGRINDLLEDEHKPCAPTQNLLAYLAGALLSYRDEGVEFAPPILLCDGLEAFLKAFPGAVSYKVGEAALDPGSGPKILKDCAPLSGSNWSIFIERSDGGRIKYGVFTYFRLPTAIPLHEGITINSDIFCVLTRKTSVNTVEMRGAKGNVLTLIFSTLRENPATGKPIESFAADCCRNVGEDRTPSDFRAYFARLLDASLTACHGTILLCAEALDLSAVPELRDAVPVDPILDFYTAFAEFQSSATAGSILSLQRCEELLNGFLRCDGMVVFDERGRVNAYRVFYKPNGGSGDTGTVIVGGARRRAYEGLKGLVGSRLTSVLFRSQDGLTLHHGGKK